MENKTDIKYLGIDNICFSLTEKNDKREKIFTKQRLTRGFDDSETWSLRDTIAKFIVPRLKVFREVTNGYPGDLTEKKWATILTKIEKAFELVILDKMVWTDKENKIYQEGMQLFSEYFMHLWW